MGLLSAEEAPIPAFSDKKGVLWGRLSARIAKLKQNSAREQHVGCGNRIRSVKALRLGLIEFHVAAVVDHDLYRLPN
jgi:hypothetical protein